MPKIVGKVSRDFRDGRVEVTFKDHDEVRVVSLFNEVVAAATPDLTGATVHSKNGEYSITVPGDKHCVTCRCDPGYELVFV